MKKISGMATLGAMGSNNVIDDLTPEEKEYYNTILEASKSFWKLSERKKKTFISQDITRIDEPVKEEIPEPVPETKPPIDEMPLSEIPFDDSPMEETPAEPVIEEPPVEQTTVPEEVPEGPVPEKVPESPAEVIAAVPEMDDDALVVIRILEDLPPFSGPDVNYDLKKEDIVRMPAVMAKALINRGKARIMTTA